MQEVRWQARLSCRFSLAAIDPLGEELGVQNYATAEANTNQAESFFSRLGRAEIGHNHHIAGPHLMPMRKMAWRDDNRRTSNGVLYLARNGRCDAQASGVAPVERLLAKRVRKNLRTRC